MAENGEENDVNAAMERARAFAAMTCSRPVPGQFIGNNNVFNAMPMMQSMTTVPLFINTVSTNNQRPYVDAATHTQPQPPSQAPRPHQLPVIKVNGLNSNTVPENQNVRRPGFGTVTDLNRIPLIVNYFKINVPKKILYEYNIEIIPGTDDHRPSFGSRGRGRGGNWDRGRGGNFNRGRGGRGSNTSSPEANYCPDNFKPMTGKLKKEISDQFNRDVLNYVRETNCSRSKSKHHHADLFYDGDDTEAKRSRGGESEKSGKGSKGIEYVYDGVKNFYTIKPLNGLPSRDEDKIDAFGQEKVHKEVIKMERNDLGKNVKFFVVIKFATTVDLDTINQFVAGKLAEPPESAFKAVDIIMRHGPTVDSVVLGHALFPKDDPNGSNVSNDSYQLTPTKNLKFGHYQTRKACSMGLTLNIDRMSAVFVDCGPLLSVMAKAMKLGDGALKEQLSKFAHRSYQGHGHQQSFGQGQQPSFGQKKVNIVDEVIEKMKGIKVSTNYGNYRRTFKLTKITYLSAAKLKLEDTNKKNGHGHDSYNCDNNTETVASYFESKYEKRGRELNELPCAQIGSRARPVYIPLVLLNVEPNQNVSNLKPHETIELIKHCSSQPTSARFDVIKKSADHVKNCPHAKQTLNKFGLNMSSDPVKLDAFVIDHPTLLYGDKKTDQDQETKAKERYKPDNGRWSLSTGHKLYQTKDVVDRWCVINFVNRLDAEKIDHFLSRLINIGHQIGMDTIRKPDKVFYSVECSRTFFNENNFFSFLRSQRPFADAKPNLIMFIFNKKDDAMYQDIKYHCDVRYTITNACVSDKIIDLCWNSSDASSKNVGDEKSASDFTLISNILLKINIKFDGINNLVSFDDIGTNQKISEFMSDKLMFIGADVTHPDSASDNSKVSTSIAAITSTYDKDHIFYYPCIRVQYGYSEIITDIYDMFLEIGHHYFHKNNNLPNRILFYRDGVSDGMFADIFDKEINKMKDAFRYLISHYKLNQDEPKITFIVVQKRHHTRFMIDASKVVGNGDIGGASPISDDGSMSSDTSKDDLSKDDVSKDKPIYERHKYAKDGNIFGGVTIDTKIIHPFDYDFFLCSQDCVQGTPRPAHYYVLKDDNSISPDDLYNITFALCHTYAPATRALSIPAPVQYAHLAAKRSRHHLVASRAEKNNGVTIWQKMDVNDLKRKSININRTIDVKMPLKERMYFI